jgi:hypothetical protein
MLKNFAELEQMGIVAMFKDNELLNVITRNGYVWIFDPISRVFSFKEPLF